MKKNLIQTLFFIIALSVCGPLQAHALMWNYSGSSQATNTADGTTTNAQFTMTMSDQIMGYGAGTPFDPYSGGQLMGNIQYVYQVSSWQMDFAGGPTYQGNDGALFGFGMGQTPADNYLLFDELYLGGGPVTGSFDAHDPIMRNYDQSEFDYGTPGSTQYAQLGPVLELGGLHLSSSSGFEGPFQFQNNTLFLTRSASPVNPVPEPLTIVLMGIGVAGVVGSRARRRQARGVPA